MIEPENVKHHTRDVLVRDAGRGFSERYHFQVTQEDANDGIFECVGEIKLAGNFNFQRDNHFYDEDLIHSIHRLIKKTHWHFVELMILAIKALANRQLQYASTGFFENSNKTFFGFLIHSNPYAKSYLTWKTYRESDSIGITGKGILETLKIIGNSGVTAPGLMFDLCYLLINLNP